MFFYYLKIALKNLWHNRKYAAINILGFAFSLSFFIAILLYAMHEFSFDQYHAKSGQIYKLFNAEDNKSSIDYRVRDIIVERFPEVENACLFQQINRKVNINVNGEGYYVENLASVDENFFEVFDVDFLSGNNISPFENIHSAVVTKSTARLLFGKQDPIGKEITIRNQNTVFVTAVIKDFPKNSSLNPNLLVNAANEDFRFRWSCQNSDDLSSYRWPFDIYAQLNTNDASGLEKVLSNSPELFHPYVKEVGVTSLSDIYLKDNTIRSNHQKGNLQLLQMLCTIAVIILTLAVINYINLTLAQQQKRNKEMGVRKTIGASRDQVFLQLITESVLIVFVSFFMGVILFELLNPVFRSLFQVELHSRVLLTLPTAILVFAGLILIGFFSGLWPALIYSSFNPVSIFSKRMVSKSKKSWSRNGLTVFQFTTSICLIVVVTMVWKQIDFAKHKYIGFNHDQLLRVDLPSLTDSSMSHVTGFANSLRSHSYITYVSLTSGIPGDINFHMGANIEGKTQSIAVLMVDSVFIQTFNIKLKKGRNFLNGDRGKACLINETAYKYFEWENLNNKVFNNGRPGGFEVIGVVEDFHLSSLHETIEPVAIIFNHPEARHITVKIKGDHIAEVMDFVRSSWKRNLAEYPLEYYFYDDWFEALYKSDERFGRVLGFFAVLAIIISCIGILGLVIFTAERKTKEIGIRKVNGASVQNIIFLLTRELTVLVVISFVIASPVAYFFIEQWLADFAYRTEMSWWVFALSGISALGIAWSTVGWHSLKAASKNPIQALRYE